jgi:hypothetical protein
VTARHYGHGFEIGQIVRVAADMGKNGDWACEDPAGTATWYLRADELELVEMFVTHDSGERAEYASGMVRDTDAGKLRYDLIDRPMLKRVAALYTRGAVKYGDNNWRLANSEEELVRFQSSAFRHFMQWINGERDEDHGAAVFFNIAAAEYVRMKLTDENDSK